MGCSNRSYGYKYADLYKVKPVEVTTIEYEIRTTINNEEVFKPNQQYLEKTMKGICFDQLFEIYKKVKSYAELCENQYNSNRKEGSLDFSDFVMWAHKLELLHKSVNNETMHFLICSVIMDDIYARHTIGCPYQLLENNFIDDNIYELIYKIDDQIYKTVYSFSSQNGLDCCDAITYKVKPLTITKVVYEVEND